MAENERCFHDTKTGNGHVTSSVDMKDVQELKTEKEGEEDDEEDEVYVSGQIVQRRHNFEDVITAMGPPGRYQILQCAIMSVNYVPAVFVNMGFVFLGLEPSFSCSPVNETSFPQEHHSHLAINETMTSSYKVSYEEDSCRIRISSNTSKASTVSTCPDGYQYAGGRHVSIVTEWDLVCDARGTAQLAQSFLNLGWCLGVVIVSIVSDKYGRRKAILIAVALSSISEISAAFAPNVYVFITMRFCTGFFASGISSITFVLGAEFFSSKQREIYTAHAGLLMSFSSLAVVGIAYVLRYNTWRNLQLCMAICCLAPFLTFFAEESASWSYSHGNIRQATRILQKACRLNRVNFDKIKDSWDTLLCHVVEPIDDKANNQSKTANKYNLFDMFRIKKIRLTLFIAWIISLTHNLAFFGMYLSASTLAGNLYLNAALMSLLEIPSCLCSLVMLRYKGRRSVMMFCMSAAAVCIVVSTFLRSEAVTYSYHVGIASTAFFLLGRLSIGSSYICLYLYVPEMFPTQLRSTAVGLSITGSCVGLIIAPFLVPFHAVVPWGPGVCLVTLMVISVVLLFKLPETKGKQLESKVEAPGPV